MNNGEGSYRRFLSGDKDALIEIIRDYKDGLILYINSIVNNIQIAEDITEDTFVKLYTDRPSFRGASSFKTWLYSIARFTAIDYLRKYSGKTVISFDEMFMIPDEANIEQNVVDDEEKVKLFSSIKRLKPEYGQVIYLMYFEKCNNIETVVIPDTVTVISGAFGRTSLRSIDIPDSVKVIESGAFEYCENLEEVTGGKNVEAVGKDVFICTPWLENQKKQSCFVCLGDVLIDVSACNENEVVVPDGIKSIGSGVLGANKNITSFVIPEGVTRICDGAFAFCSNLENLVIPDSVQYLGKNILLYCEKIESVHIPSGLTEIGSLTFCSSYLKSVDIPEGVTEICENAFRDSIYLKEINIPDTVNTIGFNAFFNTQWLADRSAENPLVMFKNNIISGYACTGNVIIPDGVEKIDGFVFACSTATSIFVPDSVKRIETRAFSGADNLQLLRLPEDLEYIGKNIVTSPKCDIVHTSMEEYDPDTYLANINSNPSKAYGVNYSENEKSSGICGDIDMNGIADLSDLTCLSLYLLGSRNLSGAQLANADVDHDGIVSITDLPRFKQYISKDISSLD